MYKKITAIVKIIKIVEKGVYEITINYNDCVPYFINSGGFYNIGITKAYQAGLIKKDCHICKWQKEDTFGKAI